MKLRKLTAHGAAIYYEWLQIRKPGELPPNCLIAGADETEELQEIKEVDETKIFETRYDFGSYIAEIFNGFNVPTLLAEKNDGVWNWLTVLYFAQFGQKSSKYWHYLVTRKGHSGSLAYRHLARTSYEMYWRHEAGSKVLLSVDMSTWGQISESLTSRQNIAHHQSCIATANMLYVENGVLRRGAATRVPTRAKRKPGDRRGRGGAERLALAVRRLCRTYDTHVLEADQMVKLLPREFAGFAAKIVPASS